MADHSHPDGPHPDGPPPAMRTVASTVRFASPWLTLREDEFVRDDGGTGVYGVVDKPDFALVIPEQDGYFHLVEQYRYPVRRRSWEFPQGGWPTGKSGTALELAQAELAEETGYRASNWRHLSRLHEAIGFSSQAFDIFHATGLTPGPTAREASEADMVQAVFSDAELRAMIADGRIVDGSTVAAYGLLRVIG